MAKIGNAMTFYWDRYLTDPNLALCSFAAQGLWVRMMGYCSMSEEHGYLLVGGKRVDTQQLALLVGHPFEEVSGLVSELEMHAVFSRTRGGVVYNRGMVKDERKRQVARENGKKGGNPSLSSAREIPDQDNPPLDNLGSDNPPRLNPAQPSPLREGRKKENQPAASLSDPASAGGGFLKGGNGQHHPDYERIIGPIEGLINSPRPLVFGIVQEWLEQGTTPGEILDTINAVLRRQRADDPSWQPGSLKYFGPAIERTRIARIAGKPPTPGGRPVRSVHEGGPRTQRMWSHAERADWMKAHGFELMFSAHPTVQAKLREEGVLEHWPTAREI